MINRISVVRNCRIKYVIWGMVTLFLGLLLYLLLRPNTYISRFALRFLPFDLPVLFSMIQNPILKFYLADYLWAFSLSCWLRCIFINEQKKVFSITIVTVTGTLYELAQCSGIVSGTGDVIDCLLYLLAAWTVNRLI